MITNYLKNKIQDYLFPGVAFTPPTTYYIALSKTEPLADGTGVTEPVGGGYTRLAINRGLDDFTLSVNGVVKNKVTLVSSESTGVWGSLPYYGIYDSQDGGNLLYGGAFVYPRNIDIETQLVIEPNGTVLELN